MENNKSFLRENRGFFIVIILIFALLSLGYFLGKNQKIKAEKSQTFFFEEIKDQQSLKTPTLVIQLIFNAIKNDDISAIEECLLTEQEYSELKNKIQSVYQYLNWETHLYDEDAYYTSYKDYILGKFETLIQYLKTIKSYDQFNLDDTYEGTTLEIDKIKSINGISEVINGVTLVISLANSRTLANKTLTIEISPLIKTSSNQYKLVP